MFHITALRTAAEDQQLSRDAAHRHHHLQALIEYSAAARAKQKIRSKSSAWTPHKLSRGSVRP